MAGSESLIARALPTERTAGKCLICGRIVRDECTAVRVNGQHRLTQLPHDTAKIGADDYVSHHDDPFPHHDPRA